VVRLRQIALALALALALPLAGCSFKGGANPGADARPDSDATASDATFDAIELIDAPPGTAFRKELAITGDAVDEDLSDFPLYVELTDADLAARSQADASDIYFTDADGVTPLDYEIEAWDDATGALIAWVRVPTIDDTDGAAIYLRYGEPSIAAPANPAGVWSANFLTVFHMNNDPDTPIVDSLGARDGTAHDSMDATDLVDARLGLGLELDGTNDIIDFDNPITGASQHTFSGWVDQQDSADGEAFIVLGSGGALRESRFLHTSFGGGPMRAGFYTDDHATDDDIQGDGFVLVHWTYDDNRDSRIYVDGALVDGPQNFANAEDTQGMEGRIGNAPGGGMGFGTNMGLNGIVDEVRIADTARSAAWIAAEFANQSDPAGFYRVGDEEPL
jgi:hypothetical protein